MCSPRERRWAAVAGVSLVAHSVLSARAEVGQLMGNADVEQLPCSPRERRWASLTDANGRAQDVLSARAEVGRPSGPPTRNARCALRGSGGGPQAGNTEQTAVKCSPRERRWAARLGKVEIKSDVLSARAEVSRSAISATGLLGGGADGFLDHLGGFAKDRSVVHKFGRRRGRATGQQLRGRRTAARTCPRSTPSQHPAWFGHLQFSSGGGPPCRTQRPRGVG